MNQRDVNSSLTKIRSEKNSIFSTNDLLTEL